jgi:dihydropyrimidinase
MSLLFKSGTLITASEVYCADILVEGEKIIQIGQNLSSNGAEVIEATGKMILPGGVDVHTHFDLPMFNTISSDDHYTGHKAAAFGGTTTAIDFVSHHPGSLKKNIEDWHIKADSKAAIDYGFHMNITRLDGVVEKEITQLPKEGITSLKVFTAYNGNLRLLDSEIFRVLRIAKDHGLLTMIHAENGDVIEILIAEARAMGYRAPEYHARTRPAWGAVEATFRGCALSAQAEAPIYIVHMNASGEVDQIKYAREHGINVMGETCPQYLFFNTDFLKRPDGAKWVCSPPVRSIQDNEKLWKGLTDGTLQVISTDHCAFFYNGKQSIEYEGQPIAIPGKELGANDFSKIPNGLPGVEDRLPVLWTYGVGKGRLTPNQFVALNCTNPAKIFGLYPKKGTLLPGSDADIVIWDPNISITYGVGAAHHRTDYNLYEGWELIGYPEMVFLRGHKIVDHQQWLGSPGSGRFQFRQPFTPIL